MVTHTGIFIWHPQSVIWVLSVDMFDPLQSALVLQGCWKRKQSKKWRQSHGVEPMLQTCNSHFEAAHFISFCPLFEQPTTIQFRWPNPMASISKKAKQIQHYVRKIRSKLWVCGTSN